jgi:drug/metabolite transporter (DMT)-like permease
MSLRLLGALVAVVIWGLSFVATRLLLDELSPVTLVFTRFALSSLVLLALTRGTLPPRRLLPSLALMAFIGIFTHQMLQAWGLTMTTAMNTGWLIGLIPIWTALLSHWHLGERLSLRELGGLAVGFGGALLIVTNGRFSAETVFLPSTAGDFLVFLSTITWALYSILGRRALRELGSRRATTSVITLGTMMLLPFFIHERGWEALPALSPTGWGAIVFLGIGASVVGYILWFAALDRLPTTRVASLLYLEPIVTLFAAMLVLGEQVRPATTAGGLLILLGVAIVQMPHDWRSGPQSSDR